MNESEALHRSMRRVGRGLGAVFGIAGLSALTWELGQGTAWLVPAVLGAAVLGWGLVPLVRYARLRAWRQVMGRLEAFELAHEYVSQRYSSLTYFYPDVRYRYQVGGKEYRSERVSLEKENVWVPEEALAPPVWSRWQSGTDVVVFYDPARPAEAVLIRSLAWRRASHHLALVLGGALVCGLAAALALAGR